MTVSYRDIKADVMGRLTRGDWRPGDLLPNEADLADSYGCARATVNRALRELAEDGVLDRKRKAGTRVRMAPARQARFDIPLTRRDVEERGASYRYALVSRETSQVPDWLAARMGLGPQTEVLHLRCMHYADGAPHQHEDRWINLGLLPQARMADFSAEGPNEWLVATVPFSDVEIGFSAVAAEEPEARLLGCKPGAPLFQMDRTTWFHGDPVTYVRLRFAPGHRMTTRY